MPNEPNEPREIHAIYGPALTPDDWQRGLLTLDAAGWVWLAFERLNGDAVWVRTHPEHLHPARPHDPPMVDEILDPAKLRALIALLNAALPANDPRKLTREKLRDLRACIDAAVTATDADLGAGYWRAAPLLAFVDALTSYLPPEPVT